MSFNFVQRHHPCLPSRHTPPLQDDEKIGLRDLDNATRAHALGQSWLVCCCCCCCGCGCCGCGCGCFSLQRSDHLGQNYLQSAQRRWALFCGTLTTTAFQSHADALGPLQVDEDAGGLVRPSRAGRGDGSVRALDYVGRSVATHLAQPGHQRIQACSWRACGGDRRESDLGLDLNYPAQLVGLHGHLPDAMLRRMLRGTNRAGYKAWHRGRGVEEGDPQDQPIDMRQEASQVQKASTWLASCRAYKKGAVATMAMSVARLEPSNLNVITNHIMPQLA